MEKFKELSSEEINFINGGMDSVAMQPVQDASETWWWKGLVLMNDASDFISGLGDGFLKGFDTTNKQW
ncbi:hypothetical protein AAGF08_20110 [Algoriphagus sp. SE2]|uniref:hypothetical protein n=1 Tax=Algoriphagus sp. SE2 TaxID=3141536 RepID=UPI0031CD1E21